VTIEFKNFLILRTISRIIVILTYIINFTGQNGGISSHIDIFRFESVNRFKWLQKWSYHFHRTFQDIPS